MSTAYRIPDEPTPGRLAPYTVHPFWPLITLMLGGAWIGLPWFVFNGVAMGSASLRKEVVAAVAAPLGAVAMLYGSIYLGGTFFALSQRALPYLFVLVVATKLGFGYWLYLSQQRSFEIYRHFGGPVRQGMLVALGATLLRGYVIPAAFARASWLGALVM
ncbi:hypothetical protein [Pendulispora albinea]|uniref:Uncharacterized protein n=1 Tax=Pendulispora albinea TaxID=2741071 RepID=A0ABZ2M0K7_9BACT